MDRHKFYWVGSLLILLPLLGSTIFSYTNEPLEVAAEKLGIVGYKAKWAPMPDYSLKPFLGLIYGKFDLSCVFSGFLGSLIVMILTYLVIRVARRSARQV